MNNTQEVVYVFLPVLLEEEVMSLADFMLLLLLRGSGPLEGRASGTEVTGSEGGATTPELFPLT